MLNLGALDSDLSLPRLTGVVSSKHPAQIRPANTQSFQQPLIELAVFRRVDREFRRKTWLHACMYVVCMYICTYYVIDG